MHLGAVHGAAPVAPQEVARLRGAAVVLNAMMYSVPVSGSKRLAAKIPGVS